jgi:hypothetical protein
MEHVTHMEEIRNAYKILVRKPEGKRPVFLFALIPCVSI